MKKWLIVLAFVLLVVSSGSAQAGNYSPFKVKVCKRAPEVYQVTVKNLGRVNLEVSYHLVWTPEDYPWLVVVGVVPKHDRLSFEVQADAAHDDLTLVYQRPNGTVSTFAYIPDLARARRCK